MAHQDSDDRAPGHAADDRAGRPPETGLVLPSAPIHAIVRHSEPPASAPPDLEPYVIRTEGDWGAAWVLTSDVVAFGDADIPQRFRAWRENWQRTWVLDARVNLEFLAGYCANVSEPKPHHIGVSSFVNHLTETGDVEVGGAALTDLARHMGALADEIRNRNLLGVGIVDASDRPRRSGLVRAWPHLHEPLVVAADQHLRLTVLGGAVMSLAVLAEGVVVEEVEPVDQVEIDEVVKVTGSNRPEPLVRDLEHARPLAWIAPATSRWRARPTPEVLAYARTFGGIGEATQYASALRLPVRFTTSPPVQNPDDHAAESSA